MTTYTATRAALILSLATVALAPAPAAAHRPPAPYQGPFARDLAVAAAYWQVEASCAPSTVRIVFADLPGTALGGTAASTFMGGCASRLRNFRFGGRRYRTPRFILIDAGAFNDDGYSAEWWCDAITHEYGHLLGYDHSSDPSSPMYPPPVAGSVPACALL